MTSCRCTHVCLLFLLGCLVNGMVASLTCNVHLLSNGSALYNLSEAATPGCDYEWAISGVVVAHEEEHNKTLVVWETNSTLLLKKYYPNTTYKVSCSKWQEVTCQGPAQGIVSEPPHDDNTGVVIAAVVTTIVFVLVLLLFAIGRYTKIGCIKRGERPREDAGKEVGEGEGEGEGMLEEKQNMTP